MKNCKTTLAFITLTTSSCQLPCFVIYLSFDQLFVVITFLGQSGSFGGCQAAKGEKEWLRVSSPFSSSWWGWLYFLFAKVISFVLLALSSTYLRAAGICIEGGVFRSEVMQTKGTKTFVFDQIIISFSILFFDKIIISISILFGKINISSSIKLKLKISFML